MTIYGHQIRKSFIYELIWRMRYNIRLQRHGQDGPIRCPFCSKMCQPGNSFGNHIRFVHERKNHYLAIQIMKVSDIIEPWNPGQKWDNWPQVERRVLDIRDKNYIPEPRPWDDIEG